MGKAEKQRKIDMGEETEEEEEEREAKEAKKRKEKAAKEKEEKKKAEETKKKAQEAEDRKKQKEEAARSFGGKLTWEEYADSLVDRGFMASSVLKSPRTAKDWDLQLLSLSSKISAEALAKTEM